MSSFSYREESLSYSSGDSNSSSDLNGVVSSFGNGSYGSSASSGTYGGSSSSSFNQQSSGVSAAFVSQVEQALLRSNVPVESNETEEITVNGVRGIWLNKAEVSGWSGAIPISAYSINQDSNAEIITKRSGQSLEYVQELAIRYLRPPTPPAPGEIVIIQQGNQLSAPAPPLVIRQQPARPFTPAPLVIREAPPQAPQSVGRKVITISGRRIPPPPRKVIIERLAPLPAKPQSVLIERWLPYAQTKRRVVFQGAGPDSVAVKPRNVIIQWEAPQVNVRKEVRNLGVVRADPNEYRQRYGASLRSARDLPQFVLEIKAPNGIRLAAESGQQSAYELEGDLQGFRFVDLDREGLSEYRVQLQRLGISYSGDGAGSSSWSNSSFGGSGFGGAAVSNFGGSGGYESYQSSSSSGGAGGFYSASFSSSF